jgi:two-component system cell cycle response regulator DivK
MPERAATILLVEDNEDNRIVYSTILKYAGHRVVEATDGEAGVSLARSERPDLILMDVSIPLLDGWEATRILKADPETRHIPIVALTAHALEEDRAKAREVGCDGYIAKPAEPRVVLAHVQEYLARASGEATPARPAATSSAF